MSAPIAVHAPAKAALSAPASSSSSSSAAAAAAAVATAALASPPPPLSLTFELHPACRLHVAYFLDVRNASALKSRMLAGHLRAALLDATAVCGVRQVHAAAAAALTARRRGEMTTRNAHTEMIFCMSPNRNIKASLDQFGAGEATTDLLLAAFELDDAAASSSSSSNFSSSSSSTSSTLVEFAAACSSVEGRRADPSALHERCNVAQICKLFKIANEELAFGGAQALVHAVVARAATKDFA